MQKKQSTYTVYIDESGDLGAEKGTQWFVLSAVVVAKNQEKIIRDIMEKIKKTLNVREIHLTKISDYFKRAYIVQELSIADFTYMNIIFDTNKFDVSKIPNSIVAYNYICKYLLQRVSWYLESINQVADVVLSARGTSRDQELIEYIQDKLMPYPGNNINKKCFNKIEAKSASIWDMLQLADVCATTTFLSYEKNKYGFRVPCFSKVLSNHLYRRFGKAESYGIKYFSPDMKPGINELQKDYVCIKKERTSGTTTT